MPLIQPAGSWREEIIPVIAQKRRCEQYSAPEALFNGNIHDFALVVAFLLRGHGQQRKHHFAGAVQRADVLGFKKYAHGRLQVLQHAHSLNGIHYVPGKARHALAEDQLYPAALAVSDHPVELVPFVQGGACNPLIRVDIHQYPAWVLLDESLIMVLLKLIGRGLARVVRGYPAIGAHPLVRVFLKQGFFGPGWDHVHVFRVAALIAQTDLLLEVMLAFQVQRSCPPWLCCIVPAHTKLYKYTIMHAIGH